ncbi:acetyl-CoA C-acetyltransferase [Fulvivirgaceae bacterium PWU4]|uniref:Acetyl-CoA C-acetyltransferase n=1 Tax=Chryseosolibacter histidini TaxID=2782349 RepID=A0AAP2DM07_9BACT|nr:acetyl-CoA C-acetyltransferase [Chryseosolibacter histidini]MBT1697607.1 acetyl-CoA C-acetyltransferase [Chryseosolibacter histidini]
MQNQSRRVAIIGGQRIPFVRSFREYSRTTNQEMLIATLRGLVKKCNLEGRMLGDVSLGAVMTSSIEWNLAREVVQGSGLDAHTPAFNVQRACGTSLETVNLIALKIAVGQIDSGIAGGSDTNSDLPIMVQRALAWKLIDINNAKSFGERLSKILRIRPSDLKPAYPGIVEPRTGLSMGQHTERMVKEWKISRQEQDQLAYESHVKAARAYQEGFYNDLVTPFKNATRDTIVRGDTTLEKLAKLKPVFDKSEAGTMTAGNSTAFTDGASAVLLGSEEFARQNNLPVQAYFKDAEAAAVDYVQGAGLLMAPTIAVARMLRRHNLTLQDFDFYEIHEAFAGQVLSTLKAWESAEYCRKVLGLEKALGAIDRSKMNVKGGSLALGHPFGATGARTVATLAKLLHQKGSGRGLISICTGGGMGVVAILER